MHTQISLKSFAPSFSLVRTVPKRSQLPILEGVLVRAERDQVTLQTTDLQRLISVTFPAMVFRPGAAVVPVRRLQALLPHRGLATSIGFEARPDHTVQVTLGERSYLLEGANPADFPDAQPVPAEGWTVDAPTFRLRLQQVEHAAARDGSRPVLNGIHLRLADQLMLEAADGFRLAQTSLPVSPVGGESVRLVLPLEAVKPLLALLGTERARLHIACQPPSCVWFSVGGRTLQSRLIEEPYPDSERLIPRDAPLWAEVPRPALLDAASAALPMALDDANRLRLTPHEGGLVVRVKGERFAAPIWEATSHQTHAIGVNARYLQDALAAYGKGGGSGALVVRNEAAERPLVLSSPDEPLVEVIMPMHLGDD